jgi:hypothetical protein
MRRHCPMTWEALSGYLEQLGVRVQVIAEDG